MLNFGVFTTTTETTMQPVDLAKWAEDAGFESIFLGEHSHIPTSRISPFPLGGDLPGYYSHFFDPFIGLAAAASVTTRVKLGTGVILVPEHNPIHLAKQVACLDYVSGGRLLFGIGAGWNAEEMADHGVAFKDRWKITRESVLAMREIWSNDEAEFHGKFVNFDPLWCYPKPIQKGGPPILMGAGSKWVPKRVAEYCDGWVPLDGWGDLKEGLTAIREECEKIERPFEEIQLGVMTMYDLATPNIGVDRIGELVDMGFTRILLALDPGAEAAAQYDILEAHKETAAQIA
jgi:probable F420-dependent oxidoreductase